MKPRILADSNTVALLLRSVVGILLLIGVGALVGVLVRTAPKIETEDRPRSLRVQVFEAQQVDLPRQWRGFGTVEAERQADVPARVGAVVMRLPEAVEVGRVVKAGDVLVELDDSDFVKDRDEADQRIKEVDAQIAQLATEEVKLRERVAVEEQVVTLARAEYERQVRRGEQNAASVTDIERALRTLLQAERFVLELKQAIDLIGPRREGLTASKIAAERQKDRAQLSVDRATIKAPIDGIIAEVDVEENESVQPGSRVVRIVDPRLVEVPIQLPASARVGLGVGDPATVFSRSHPPDCQWSATITRVGAFNAPQRTFTVYALIDQTGVSLEAFAGGASDQQVLVPGMFVTSRLATTDAQPRWVVPARSVQEGRVRLVKGSHIETIPVTTAFDYEGKLAGTGLPDDQWLVLNESFEDSDLIVLSASLSILDGQEVIAVLPDPAPAGDPEERPDRLPERDDAERPGAGS
ncbi:MAG: HlyD family efflux transporter periplasmic adaptor subunit [Planctomycetota bacterium]